MKHVFISYVRENSDIVDKLRDALIEAGIKVWLDRDQIEIGSKWQEAIKRAIKNGAFVIVCFSKEYLARSKAEEESSRVSHMNEELFQITQRLRKSYSGVKWFLPVILSEGSIDEQLPEGEINEIELRDYNILNLHSDWDTGIKRIIKAISPSHRASFSFFSPLQVHDTALVFREYYSTPLQASVPVNAGATTVSFMRSVEYCQNQFKRLHQLKYDVVRIFPNIAQSVISETVNSDRNVISYASSTINPVTDVVMSKIEGMFGNDLRFVYEKDLDQNVRQSTFDYSGDEKSAPACALLSGSTILRKDPANGVDYGVIIRAKVPATNSASKLWWVVAGCGRPGSVAVQEMLFNPVANRTFAGDLESRVHDLQNRSFVALVYRCRYDINQMFRIPAASDTDSDEGWHFGKAMQIELVDFQTAD